MQPIFRAEHRANFRETRKREVQPLATNGPGVAASALRFAPFLRSLASYVGYAEAPSMAYTRQKHGLAPVAMECTICANTATWEGAASVSTRSSPARSGRW